jgi:hypothetical protein
MGSSSVSGEGAGGRFWRAAEGGVTVEVRVQPRSRRPGVQGRRPAAVGERLCIGVSEPAEDGRANAAACAALARALGVPVQAVAVLAGHSRREKILRVAGDAAALASRLEALCVR